MKKFYVFLLFLIINTAYGQQYFTENFNGGNIPRTWQILQKNTIESWEISLKQPIDDGYLAVVSGKPAGGQDDEWIITPSINLSASIHPALYFESNYSVFDLIDQNTADFRVYYSIDNGQNWQQIWTEDAGYSNYDYTTQLAQINVPVPQLAGNSNVKFAWRVLSPVNNSFDGTVWIDNISAEENRFAPVQSVTPALFNGGPNEIIVTKSAFLIANVLPANSNQTVKWSIVSGGQYATLYNDGLIYGNSVGQVVVRATSNENANIFGDITLNIILDPFNDGCNQRYNFGASSYYSIATQNGLESASDFNVAPNTKFSLSAVTPLILAGSFNNPKPLDLSNFDIKIYSDNAGTPGTQIASYPAVVPTSVTGQTTFNVRLNLPQPLELDGGATGKRFWVGLSARTLNGTNASWGASTYVENNDSKKSYRSTNSGPWVPMTVNGNFAETIMDIEGICQLLGVNDIADDSKVLVYPNPTTGKVFISSKNEIKNINIYDISGQLVKKSVTEVDLSAYTTGTYLLQIVGKNGDVTVKKVIKK